MLRHISQRLVLTIISYLLLLVKAGNVSEWGGGVEYSLEHSSVMCRGHLTGV